MICYLVCTVFLRITTTMETSPIEYARDRAAYCSVIGWENTASVLNVKSLRDFFSRVGMSVHLYVLLRYIKSSKYTLLLLHRPYVHRKSNHANFVVTEGPLKCR